ncbi:MAG: anthranilate synthase component II [Ruminococcus sp.]|jgi:para-aminobenzoate synthetase component 2
MYVMIDNYDSFVYNLAIYMRELGEEIKLIRNDQVSVKHLLQESRSGRLKGVIISPGPKSPEDCGNSRDVVRYMAGKVPILGVCLGHQIIGHVFGAEVSRGERPMHGKVTSISHSGKGLFAGLPSSFDVTRYHSLAVRKENFPRSLQVDAWGEDGTIQALSHRFCPVYGVQFHPEAVLTQYGHQLLENYIRLCEKWWENYENVG